MLYELFSWLNSSEENLPSSHPIVTRSDFEHEHKEALLRRRILMADVHDSRSHSSSSGVVSNASLSLAQHTVFLDFMTFCENELTENESVDLFFLALKYLLSPQFDNVKSATSHIKVNLIFLWLLQDKKEVALDFYHANQLILDPYIQINCMVRVEKTGNHLARLTSQLVTQENPITIAYLFGKFIDDTELFAAAILWLIQRGVSIERILQTGLLQNFMLYNLALLHTENSPINQLYLLLNYFPESQGLVKAAERVGCEDRGFKAYTITGVMRDKSQFEKVEIKTTCLDFSPTEVNFAALYQLFESSFLCIDVYLMMMKSLK